MPPPTHLKAYVVSDVHLNNHPFDQAFDVENPRRRHFREFLTRLNAEAKAGGEAQQMLLVLNGDVLDMTGSWFDATPPWDPDTGKVERLSREVLERIIDNNHTIFEALVTFLNAYQGELVFVIGNHDGLLKRFPDIQQSLRAALVQSPDAERRLKFVSQYHHPGLGLYAEHGHQFDFFNRSNDLIQHPLGDYINILIVNRFVELVVAKMMENGYSPELIAMVRVKLHDIEYLRPFSLIPLWVESIAKEFKRHHENDGKKESIETIIYWVLAEVLDTDVTRQLVEQLQLPRKFLTSMVNWYIRLPGTLPIVSFVIAQAMRRTHSNRYQFRMAQKLYKEFGYRYITFGHTHMPQVIPIGESGYFFNTGSWKPVVNLFKEAHFAVQDTQIEYLTPDVKFNKIERSGILVIDQPLDQENLPARFALQTNEGSGSLDSVPLNDFD